MFYLDYKICCSPIPRDHCGTKLQMGLSHTKYSIQIDARVITCCIRTKYFQVHVFWSNGLYRTLPSQKLVKRLKRSSSKRHCAASSNLQHDTEKLPNTCMISRTAWNPPPPAHTPKKKREDNRRPGPETLSCIISCCYYSSRLLPSFNGQDGDFPCIRIHQKFGKRVEMGHPPHLQTSVIAGGA